MAAGTTNKAPVNAYTFYSIASRQARLERLPDETPRGVFAFSTGAVDIATTNVDDAADQVFFLTFPGKAYLMDLQVTAEDLDDGTDLVFDVIVENSAGTEVVLINDTTIGQAGGSDRLDADGHLLRDVSNQMLGIKIVTAAGTPAAGAITLKGVVWLGDLPSIV